MKKREILLPTATFFVVLLAHAVVNVMNTLHISRQWDGGETISPFALYFSKQEYFLGLSYGLAGAFVVYSILVFLNNRKKGIAGVAGGITFSGLLYAAGCFFLGCCGSPMLAVYLGLFGPSFLGFTKPLIALVTLISVIIGYFWLNRRNEKNCEDTGSCSCS